jgi:hypothetical protein
MEFIKFSPPKDFVNNSNFPNLNTPDIIRYLTNFFYFIRGKRVLIIGAGGGGDIVGCLPSSFWIKSCGGIPILGSLTWERTEVYEGFGPQSFEEIDGLFDRVGTVAWGNEKTVKKDGKLPFQATKVSSYLEEPVVFLDITKGVKQLIEDLTKFKEKNQIDMIIALDVGGDIISRGNEKGLHSPLADAMTMAVVTAIPGPKALGIFGLNCDGELTLQELEEYLIKFNREDHLYGQRVHSQNELLFMKEVIEESKVVTEASNQPLLYLAGKKGESTIRNGKRAVFLDEIVTHTYFMRIENIYEFCPIAKKISETTSIEQANDILLNEMNIISEYEQQKRECLGTSNKTI